MKLIIIRHGDPDYENDTLTVKGVREAKLLSERISKLDVKHFTVHLSAEHKILHLTLSQK